MSQQFNGNIILQSGGKSIQEFQGYINDKFSEFIAKHKDEVKAELLALLREKVHAITGESMVRETLELGDPESFNIEELEGSLHIFVSIPNNSLRFWVTTPDTNVLGLKIGLSRHVDPGFLATWTIYIDAPLKYNIDFESLHFETIKTWIDLNISGLNITGNVVEAILKIANSVIKLFTNDRGFLDKIKNLQIENQYITYQLNQHLHEEIKSNTAFINEMAVDGINDIKVNLSDDYSIIINHPWSDAGYIKRASKNKIEDALKSNVQVHPIHNETGNHVDIIKSRKV